MSHLVPLQQKAAEGKTLSQDLVAALAADGRCIG